MLPPLSMGPLSVGTLPSTPCTRAEVPASTISANVPPVMEPSEVFSIMPFTMIVPPEIVA